jgi:putative transposase
MQGSALIINGTADHVHLLVRIRPAHSAAEIARVIKANSSKWVRAKWSSEFTWQTGYGVFSVSESNVAADKVYRRAGRTSSEAFVSGGVRRVPQEEQRGL